MGQNSESESKACEGVGSVDRLVTAHGGVHGALNGGRVVCGKRPVRVDAPKAACVLRRQAPAA